MNKEAKQQIFSILLLLLLLISVLSPFVGFPVKHASAVGTTKTLKIQIESSYIDATLTNFPVLIPINVTIGADCDGGNSIRFNNSDNTTQLAYEIEGNWSATGYSYVWVNVTTISSSTDTVLWMNYDDGDAIDSQNPTGVWDSGYVLVLHMVNYSDTQVNDSTAYINHGTKNTTETTGISGYGQEYDEANNLEVNCGSGASFAFNSTPCMTLEAWGKTTETTSGRLIDRDKHWASTVRGWYLGKRDNGAGQPYNRARLYFAQDDDGTPNEQIKGIGPEINDGNWHYVAFSLDWDDYFCVIDADTNPNIDTGDGDLSGIAGVNTNANTLDILIGARGDNDGASNWDGTMDEVRISNISRNESWLETTFHTINQSLNFLTIGTALLTPDDPTNFKAIPYTSTQINLTWDTTSNADKVIIMRENNSYPTDRNDAGATEVHNGTDDGAWEDTDVTGGTSYYYRIWNLNLDAESAVSTGYDMNFTPTKPDFLIWLHTDAHVGKEGSTNYRSWFFDAINDTNTDILPDLTTINVSMHIGDGIHDGDTASQWTQFHDLIENQTVADYTNYTLGNHEISGSPTLYDDVAWCRNEEDMSWTFNVSNIHFISLSAHYKTDYDYYINTTSWLNSTVWDATNNSKIVIVLCHYPIYDTTEYSDTGGYYIKDSAGGDTNYQWICDNYGVRTVDMWCAGHNHIPQEYGASNALVIEDNETLHVNVGSMTHDGSGTPAFPNSGSDSRFIYMWDASNKSITRSYNHTNNSWRHDREYRFNFSQNFYLSGFAPPDNPPTQTSESPSNETTGEGFNPHLQITVNDPDGNDMNVTFLTNASGGAWGTIGTNTSVANGTYSQTNSSMDVYDTTFFWKVMLQDGHGNWVNETYEVTTKANTAPAVSSPSPANGATEVNVGTTQLSVTINDADAETFTWNITAPHLGYNTGSGTNGSKTCTISGLAYDTTYYWYVNVTDGNDTANESYSFTTGSAVAPTAQNITLTSPTPSNNSYGTSISTSQLAITIADPNGDSIDWTIQSKIGNYSGNGENNGTKTCSISDLDYSTIYYWYVNATDGTNWTNASYHFMTAYEPLYNSSDNISIPKLRDVIDTGDTPVNWLRMFLEVWIIFLGGWFFAAVIGVLAAALYIKYDNTLVPVAFFIVMSILLGPVMPDNFLYIVGLISAFVIGFLLYKLFISTRE